MNSHSLVAAALALALGACGPGVKVQTTVSPEAGLSGLRTFRILPAPVQRGPGTARPADHPMLVNSINYRVLRDALRQEFERRGYVENSENPDFAVAFYATARERLNVMAWDYGYSWRPRWWRGWGRGFGPTVTEFTEGTVIVDVIGPASKDLLWRARGVAKVSDDPKKYQHNLRAIVAKIVAQFPAAAGHGDRR